MSQDPDATYVNCLAYSVAPYWLLWFIQQPYHGSMLIVMVYFLGVPWQHVDCYSLFSGCTMAAC